VVHQKETAPPCCVKRVGTSQREMTRGNKMTSEAREEHRRCQKQASRKRCAAAAAADPVEQTRLRVLNCSRKKKQRSQDSDFLLKEADYSRRYRAQLARKLRVAENREWRKRSAKEVRRITKRLFFS
jgi:hypothetical protein